MHWLPINVAGGLQLIHPVGPGVSQVAQLVSHANSLLIMKE